MSTQDINLLEDWWPQDEDFGQLIDAPSIDELSFFIRNGTQELSISVRSHRGSGKRTIGRNALRRVSHLPQADAAKALGTD